MGTEIRFKIVQDPDWSEEIAKDVAKWNLLIDDTEGKPACIAGVDDWNYLVSIVNNTASDFDKECVRSVAVLYRPELRKV